MSRIHNSITTEHFTNPIQFRQSVYQHLGTTKDALFELSDAVIDTSPANSFVELSCSRYFRRGWPSVHEVLQDERPDQMPPMRLYCRNVKVAERPILVGDHTAWPRLSACTLRDRTVQHQLTPVPGDRPITLEHGYSTLA